MTILHVLDHSVPVYSGYSLRSRSIVRFQARLGLRPVVLTSPKHGSDQDGLETLDGLPHHRTGRSDARLPVVRELRQMVKMAGRIATVARAEGASLLHAHSPLLNGLPAIWVGRRLGLPVVYEARAFWEDAAVDHGTTQEGSLRYRLTRALETWLFRTADRVVTICEGMRKDIVRRGVDSSRVAVVPNGVDADWFEPRPRSAPLARQLDLNGGPVFGFVGSFYRYEGLRFVLQNLPALRARMPDARVLLVGTGEEDEALRGLGRSFGNAVVFTGQVLPEAVRDYYALIDVFLCPRRRMRLTELVTPLKPLEAMAMARPVLASDVGGLSELIRPGVTGLLFRAESAEAFVDQAVRAGGQRALRERLGHAAREYVVRERSWEQIVGRYPAVYEAACRR